MRTSWTLPDSATIEMLNFTVYSKTARKTLVPWRIHGVNPPDVTFGGFYYQEGTRFVDGSHSAAQLELHTTFVGSSKERMDLVDSELKVLDVIGVFGPYAKFLVEEIGDGEAMNEGERYIEMSECMCACVVVNIYDIMMRSSRLQSQPALPPTIAQLKTISRQHKGAILSMDSVNIKFQWRREFEDFFFKGVLYCLYIAYVCHVLFIQLLCVCKVVFI